MGKDVPDWEGCVYAVAEEVKFEWEKWGGYIVEFDIFAVVEAGVGGKLGETKGEDSGVAVDWGFFEIAGESFSGGYGGSWYEDSAVWFDVAGVG